MKRVIFVGVHNKEGMTCLDSKSKSGSLIDKIIVQLKEFECVKTNIYDYYSLPINIDYEFEVTKWNNRIKYDPQNDIIVGLGGLVRVALSRGGITNFIKIKHPASIWSKHSKSQYIDDTIHLIKKNTK